MAMQPGTGELWCSVNERDGLVGLGRLLFLRHCGICCHRPGNRGRAELQGCEAMRETIIMRGAYVITDPRLGASGVIPAGAVVIVDGTIRETGPFAAIASKYPGISVVGDGTQLLMPGLVDAHSHGRGLSPIQKGVHNDFLETLSSIGRTCPPYHPS